MSERRQAHLREMQTAIELKCSLDQARLHIIRTTDRPGERMLHRARRRHSVATAAAADQSPATRNRLWYEDA